MTIVLQRHNKVNKRRLMMNLSRITRSFLVQLCFIRKTANTYQMGPWQLLLMLRTTEAGATSVHR